MGIMDFNQYNQSDVLPKEFSTPMFWSSDDIKELEGTDIVGKPITCVVA